MHAERFAKTDLSAFVELYRETTRRGDDWHWTQWRAAFFARMVFEDVLRWWYWHIETPLQFAFCLGSAEPWAWRLRRYNIETAQNEAARHLQISACLAGEAVHAMTEGRIAEFSRLTRQSVLHTQASAKYAAIK